MDYSGRIVKQIQSSGRQEGGKQTKTISLPYSFAPGLYQVVLKTEDNILVQKIVVQK